MCRLYKCVLKKLPSHFYTLTTTTHTQPPSLTLISVRVMKPLPSTSQVRKNSLVLSSRAIGPQSELLLPGLSPRPFTLPSAMSGTLFKGHPGSNSVQVACISATARSGIRHQASSLALYPVLSGSYSRHDDRDGKYRQMMRPLITLWLMHILRNGCRLL